MSKRFFRQDSLRHLRLGKKRKKLRKWCRPKGRHSKMRNNRKSYPNVVTIGYKSPRISLKPTLVHNVNDLRKLTKNNIAIIAKIGSKKKLEVIKHANELGIKVINLGGQDETRKKT